MINWYPPNQTSRFVNPGLTSWFPSFLQFFQKKHRIQTDAFEPSVQPALQHVPAQRALGEARQPCGAQRHPALDVEAQGQRQMGRQRFQQGIAGAEGAILGWDGLKMMNLVLG